MAWQCSAASNADLIRRLAEAHILTSPLVRFAMGATDRAHYVRAGDAYADSPSSIGHGATISAPHMHAYALSALAPYFSPEGNVLDVGSGSGYTVALAHRMLIAQRSEQASHTGHAQATSADEEGQKEQAEQQVGTVVGVDHIPKLVSQSRDNLHADGLAEALNANAINLVAADGRNGYSPQAPYRIIHVGAAAAGQRMLHTLLSQLATPGVMWAPVADSWGGSQAIWLFRKDEGGVVSKERIMGVQVRSQDHTC